MTDLIKIKNEINTQIADKEVFTALTTTVFKGLEPTLVKRAMLEGMIRGFAFADFLEKNVYAIPFGQKAYSLVTSIDYARKIGMRSGVCGKSEPTYVDGEDGKIISCSITIKRRVGETIGEYTSKVYFDEYYIGNKNKDGSIKKNNYGEVKPTLWDTKPRTMIAKVAEMHALRMACPEDLAKAYVEEEMEREVIEVTDIVDEKTVAEINACETLIALGTYYAKNKGKGKEFDKLIIARKKLLEEKAKPKEDDKTVPAKNS